MHGNVGHPARAVASTLLCGTAILISANVHAQELVDPHLDIIEVAHNLGGIQTYITTAIVFVDDDTALGVRRATGEVYRLDLVHGQSVEPGAVVLDLDVISPWIQDFQSEYGVQAMTLHPDFASNGYVYLRYDQSPTKGVDTDQRLVTFRDQNFSGSQLTDNVIERYIWDPAGGGSLTFDRHIYQTPVDSRYHHGGPMRFGPDGKLYVVYGELRRDSNAGWRGSETAGAQFTANRIEGVVEDNGAIIRINDDGTIPADNPFDVNLPDVPDDAGAWFAYGIRNSFGLAFDPATGNLWDTENGESTFDEVNCITPGMNSGWRWIMGPLDHPLQQGNISQLVHITGSAYRDPAFSWVDTFGVTGIHFLHGSALGPLYDDSVLVGYINGGFLWRFQLNAARDGFVFQHEGLQDGADDRDNADDDPTGTEAEELLFGRDIGGLAQGIIAIERGPAHRVFILNGRGRLYEIVRVPQEAELTGFSIAFGTLIEGDLAALQESDDVRLRARSQFGFLSSEPNVLDLRVFAITDIMQPPALSVSIEARLNNPGGSAKVRLRNQQSNLLTQVHQYPIGIEERVEGFDVSPAAQFVDAQDGSLELSLRAVVIATFSTSGFVAHVDEVDITIR
ncbi:MAG: PQQ-dependent sugar dehydrogenase [Phycisphaerales bacterium]